MPKLSDPAASPPCRVLLVGHSGTGKTGALASLVLAGYNLYLADYDNGIEILRNLLRHDPKALARVEFETFRDKYKMQGASPIPTDAVAWTKGMTWLQKCFDKGLGPNDIIAVDSLSFAAKAAMNYILKINGRLQSAPWQSDWGEAQRLVEQAVAMMAADDIESHLICSAHIAQTGGKRIETIGKERVLIDEGPIKELPSMIGKAINPVIPRYFNHMIQTHRIGGGSAAKYSLRTTPTESFELKNTAPGTIRPEYPLATGLAQYFADARGTQPNAAKAA